jgi:hypothetical protein
MGINIFVWTYSHGCDNLRLIGVLVESVDGENVASDMRRIGCKSGIELVHVQDFWKALW